MFRLRKTRLAAGRRHTRNARQELRTILNVPNIGCLNGLPYADMLAAALGSRVFGKRRRHAAAGDIAGLSLKAEGLLLGVYIGKGLGGALFYNGRPLRGQKRINEIGHMPCSERPTGAPAETRLRRKLCVGPLSSKAAAGKIPRRRYRRHV
jgi:predicted NBD/HSP70 family sugar kinase